MQEETVPNIYIGPSLSQGKWKSLDSKDKRGKVKKEIISGDWSELKPVVGISSHYSAHPLT